MQVDTFEEICYHSSALKEEVDKSQFLSLRKETQNYFHVSFSRFYSEFISRNKIMRAVGILTFSGRSTHICAVGHLNANSGSAGTGFQFRKAYRVFPWYSSVSPRNDLFIPDHIQTQFAYCPTNRRYSLYPETKGNFSHICGTHRSNKMAESFDRYWKWIWNRKIRKSRHIICSKTFLSSFRATRIDIWHS
jgi:hypothetical protein